MAVEVMVVDGDDLQEESYVTAPRDVQRSAARRVAWQRPTAAVMFTVALCVGMGLVGSYGWARRQDEAWHQPKTALKAAGSDGSMVDTKTGVKHPAKLNGQRLAGAGARKKGPLAIYSGGVYIGNNPTIWGGKIKSQQQQLPKLATDAGATVRLVITSKLVTNAKLKTALSEAMKPRLSRKMSGKGTEQALDDFGALFDNVDLKKGSEVILTARAAGLEAKVNGKKLGTVKGRQISEALVASYLDDKAVSPDIKSSVLSGLTTPSA